MITKRASRPNVGLEFLISSPNAFRHPSHTTSVSPRVFSPSTTRQKVIHDVPLATCSKWKASAPILLLIRTTTRPKFIQRTHPCRFRLQRAIRPRTARRPERFKWTAFRTRFDSLGRTSSTTLCRQLSLLFPSPLSSPFDFPS